MIKKYEKGSSLEIGYHPRKVWQIKLIQSSHGGWNITKNAWNNKDEWYIDSGFYKHIIGGKFFFLSLEVERGGNVYFGDNGLAKIIGNEMVTFGNQITKGYNVFLVNNMKHNLISVSQMYDQGHTLKFVLKKFRIKERDTGILVETTTINPKNVYILGKKE